MHVVADGQALLSPGMTARSAVTPDRHGRVRQLDIRLQAEEDLHHTDEAAADHDRAGTP